MPKPFQLVDVFSHEAFSGNPLAVVFDADDLATDEMQRITRWINLSETAFILAPMSPHADYRIRIFTLDREMAFAGHPTLGSCHAWIRSGGEPRDPQVVVQECEAGLVRIRRNAGGFAFAAPPLLRTGPVADSLLEGILMTLRVPADSVLDAHWADNGPGWIVVMLDSAKTILDVEPLRQHPRRLDVGLLGAYPPDDPHRFELRAFYTDHLGAIREDSVTGSLGAAAAQWLHAAGRATPPYTITQGRRVGRDGIIHIDLDAEGQIWVGGRTATLFQGEVVG